MIVSGGTNLRPPSGVSRPPRPADRIPVRTIDETAPAPSRLFTKGTVEEVKLEFAKFTAETPIEQGMVDAAEEAVEEFMDTVHSRPRIRTWDEFIEHSGNKDSKAGEPFEGLGFAYHCEVLADPDIKELFEELEAAIADGKGHDPILTVFAKSDKYTLKKFGVDFSDRRMRTIQNTDTFTLYLTFKYLKWASEALNMHPRAGTKMDYGRWTNQLLDAIGLDHYAAVDFSGFDRTQMRAIVEAIIRKTFQVAERSQAFVAAAFPGCTDPEKRLRLMRIREYIVHSIARSNILFDGQCYLRFGGNPSGNLLTSYINTVYHRGIMRFFVAKTGLPIPRWILCGDDAVYGGSKSEMEAVAADFGPFVEDYYNIKTKFEDTPTGETVFACPEFPPFLSRVPIRLVEDGEWQWRPAYIDTPRLTAGLYNVADGHPSEEAVQGIMGEMSVNITSPALNDDVQTVWAVQKFGRAPGVEHSIQSHLKALRDGSGPAFAAVRPVDATE